MKTEGRITHNGVQLWPRTKQGRFTSLKAKIKNGLRWVAIRSAIVALFVGVYFFGKLGAGNQIAVVKDVVAPKVFAGITKEAQAYKTIEELKEEMVGKIWSNESGKLNHPKGELFVTYDQAMRESGVCTKQGGHRPKDCDSYGPMQIKLGTLQYYWKKLYGTTITDIDALLLTQDTEKSKAFFLDCAIKIEGCVFNWTYAKKNPEYFNIVLPIIRKSIEA
jgi:hypothetical protein